MKSNNDFKFDNPLHLSPKRKKYIWEISTTTGQPALGMLSERKPPKGFNPAYSTRIQASAPMAS